MKNSETCDVCPGRFICPLDHHRGDKRCLNFYEALEEKFNSALRQPTKQGSEPSEISAFVNWVASLSKIEYAAHEQLIAVIVKAQKLLPC